MKINKSLPGSLNNEFPGSLNNSDYASNTFTLDDFKKHFKDLSRPNRFKIKLNPPSILKSSYNDEFITAMARKANIPDITIQEYVYERAGKKLHIPLHADFSEFSITFINDPEHTVRSLILKWQNQILYNWYENNSCNITQALQGEVYIMQYDNDNKISNETKFNHCWPKVSRGIDFGHDMENQLSEFTVEFVYTNQSIGIV